MNRDKFIAKMNQAKNDLIMASYQLPCGNLDKAQKKSVIKAESAMLTAIDRIVELIAKYESKSA